MSRTGGEFYSSPYHSGYLYFNRWCCQANAKGLRLGCELGETPFGSGYD